MNSIASPRNQSPRGDRTRQYAPTGAGQTHRLLPFPRSMDLHVQRFGNFHRASGGQYRTTAVFLRRLVKIGCLYEVLATGGVSPAVIGDGTVRLNRAGFANGVSAI